MIKNTFCLWGKFSICIFKKPAALPCRVRLGWTGPHMVLLTNRSSIFGFHQLEILGFLAVHEVKLLVRYAQ